MMMEKRGPRNPPVNTLIKPERLLSKEGTEGYDCFFANQVLTAEGYCWATRGGGVYGQKQKGSFSPKHKLRIFLLPFSRLWVSGAAMKIGEFHSSKMRFDYLCGWHFFWGSLRRLYKFPRSVAFLLWITWTWIIYRCSPSLSSHLTRIIWERKPRNVRGALYRKKGYRPTHKKGRGSLFSKSGFNTSWKRINPFRTLEL